MASRHQGEAVCIAFIGSNAVDLLPLTPADEVLVEAARAIIRQHYAYGRHHVGAALRTRQGQVFTAVNLEARVGRAAICAEPLALGQALLAGARDLAAIVAVRHPRPDEPDQTIQVVPPCGLCREVLSDHAPGLEVILADRGRLVKCRLLDLLPFKYRRPREGGR